MQPLSTRSFNFCDAARTASNSECAVVSEVETLRLRAWQITAPSRAMTEPNGCSPLDPPSLACSTARAINRSCSVTAFPDFTGSDGRVPPALDLTRAVCRPRRKIRTPRCSQLNTVQPAPAAGADGYLKLPMRLASTLPSMDAAFDSCRRSRQNSRRFRIGPLGSLIG